MKRPTESQMHDAYHAAIDRLSRSRCAQIRDNATMLVEVEDSMEHFRWCRCAPMSEIRPWAAQLVGDIVAARIDAEGGAA